MGGGGADVRAVRLRLRARSVSSCLECVWQNLCYQFRPEMQARSRRDTFSDGRIPPPPSAPAERWGPSMGLKSYIPRPALSPCRDGQSGEVGAQAVLGGLTPSWDTGGGVAVHSSCAPCSLRVGWNRSALPALETPITWNKFPFGKGRATHCPRGKLAVWHMCQQHTRGLLI